MKRTFLSLLALSSVCLADGPAAAPADGRDRVSALQSQWEAGQRKQANADVKRWMKAEEKSPWPWVAAADLRFHEKKFKGCISMADAALKRDPTSADGFYWRGRCLESRGKALEAANEYGAALEAQPQHLLALEGRNRLRSELGETPAGDQPN